MAQPAEYPRRSYEQRVTDDLDSLLAVLPPHICDPLGSMADRHELLEVVMDLGREPEARFPGRELLLSSHPVTEEDLDYVIQRIGSFGDDNRAGIERTLHRISAIRNREGRIVGLTSRVGRAVYGTIAIVRDLVESGRSILMMGKPGVGKTTMLREAARVLADDLKKRVIIVDTSNEIGGDGDIPHPAIGRARRMQVRTTTLQHAVMIEAVENHMPEVIVIDEIGTELEALAARTIAERGVQLIGTAHGNTLDNLMSNPTLSDLIDSILRGEEPQAELRTRDADGQVQIEPGSLPPRDGGDQSSYGGRRSDGWQRDRNGNGRNRSRIAPISAQPASFANQQRIYPFGVSRDRLERAIANLHVPATIVRDMKEATMVMTLKSYYRQGSDRVRQAEDRGVPVYVLRNNTSTQMERQLADVFHINESEDDEAIAPPRRGNGNGERHVTDAMLEAEQAISQVINGERSTIELAPRDSYVRRLQHQLAERYNVNSESRGREPNRRVKIYRS